MTTLPRPDPVAALPILILAPHSRCNCRCLMCDIWRTRETRELAPADVDRWRGEWRDAGVRRVMLTGGEALMHRGLWEICGLLREERIAITLLSSGLLVERHAHQIASLVDELIVSLDGPPAVHDLIRGVPRACERLAAGIRAVRAARPEMSITARCTVQHANCRHLRDTIASARAIDLDGISFLGVDVSSEAFDRPGGWDDARAQQVALDAADLDALASELTTLEAGHAFADGFIAEPADKLWRELHQQAAARLGLAERPVRRCNAPWVSSVIEADGTVRGCFFHPPIGNVHTAGGLMAVVNSAPARAFRSGLDVTRNPICRACVCSLALHPGEDGSVVERRLPAGRRS
jgi:Fe-coproporphyrin III synthase